MGYPAGSVPSRLHVQHCQKDGCYEPLRARWFRVFRPQLLSHERASLRTLRPENRHGCDKQADWGSEPRLSGNRVLQESHHHGREPMGGSILRQRRSKGHSHLLCDARPRHFRKTRRRDMHRHGFGLAKRHPQLPPHLSIIIRPPAHRRR